jgi:polysaccharide deacetylase family protein (PEP-CTERM system associated)
MIQQPLNAFTVDVEDWFHLLEIDSVRSSRDWSRLEPRIEANVQRLMELLDGSGVRATCFLLGWVVERHPEVARGIASAGHEVATHGYAHELLHETAPKGFREDLERAIEVTEAVTGVRPSGYRAPGFSLTASSPWAFEILGKAGMRFDSSVFPARRAHGGGFPGAPRLPHEVPLPDGTTLTEFPVSVTSVLGRRVAFCGGGYLRLFPYWFTRSRISQANARGEPVLLYIHPRDLDPGQPRLPMSVFRRFKSYVNLDTTHQKLAALLAEFRFGTVSEALAEWKKRQRT